MTWTRAELLEQLRDVAHDACADYRPDHHGECQTCDGLYDAHLARAAADALARDEPLLSAALLNVRLQQRQIAAMEEELERLRAEAAEAVRLYHERDAQATRYHDRLTKLGELP